MENIYQAKLNLPEKLSIRELQNNLLNAQNSIGYFFKSIPEETFFSKPDGGWSPAENVRHLTTATFTTGLFIKKELHFLLNLFGKGNSLKNLHQVRDEYLEKLSSGKKASGIFTPISLSFFRTKEWQQKECEALEFSIQQIVGVLDHWTEEELDTTNIIHPILGIITVREILYFSLYHLYHHSSIVEKRLGINK